MHECPQCGKEMEFIEAEPDVGIMSSGWYCATCDTAANVDDVEDEPNYPEE